MSLQFVLGNAGSGKSTYLYEYVIQEAMEHKKKNYLVIVPEQFTMSTQKRLVEMHPNHAIMNIDVLSFDRMAYRVFDELGTDTLQVLEDTGKSLLLRKVAQEQKDQLKLLGKNMKRPGYITQMKSLISEMAQYDISPEEFKEIIHHPAMTESFRYKGEDILVMYEAFLEKMEGKYITTEGILQKFIEVLDNSTMLAGATIVFDGFTGFTPIQNQVLQKLFPLAEKIMITVTCDANQGVVGEISEQELFAMSKKTIRSCTALAKQAHVEIEEPVRMDGEGRFCKEGHLEHLEQQLFRENATAFQENDKASDKITIRSLANARQELLYVASEIEKQVRAEGMKYGDFAVVCANLENYAYLAPGIFEKYHIPYFLDAKSPVVFQPFVEAILSLFDMIEENYSYPSVLRFLRTGMSNLSMEEIDCFENYILAAGIRGEKKYREIFHILPYGYTPEQLVTLNEIREKFYLPFAEFSKQVNKSLDSVEAISSALFAWISFYEMEEKLIERKSVLEQEGNGNKVKEYEQIYKMVMELLDRMVTILGEEKVSLSEYAEILATGLESLSVGVIPPSTDTVLIGDMERSRLENIKVMYLLGANDGAIPKALSHGGILSQVDRQCIKDANYEVAPTDKERAFMQKFYLYFVMTKPSCKLNVSYTRVDGDGKGLRPSYLIGTLQQLFPNLNLELIEDLPEENMLLSEEIAADYWCDSLRDYVKTGHIGENFFALSKLQKENDESAWKKLCDQAFFELQEKPLSKEAVDAIFGTNIGESVSKLEQYAKCAYAYFLKYGLQLQPRLEYTFEATDMGSLYHEALERYSKELQKEEALTWYNISPEKSEELLRQAILETYQSMAKTQIMEDARDLYLLQKVERTLKQTVWALTEQVRVGSFIPKSFEVDFKEVGELEALNYQLDEMHSMRLRGKIDRVDLHETEECVYVKIVDYKSANKKVDLQKLYQGLQVQLVLYLDATMEGLKREKPDKKVLPAAMFYYHIDRPIVDVKDGSEDEISHDILKKLRMEGMVNRDEQVIEAMHHQFVKTSHVIPVTRKKDGSISESASHVLSTDEFQILQDYGRMLIEETGHKILQGEFPCKPYKDKDQDGCAYCEYHGVCGFDLKLDGYGYHRLKEMGSDAEIIEQMKVDLEKGK